MNAATMDSISVLLGLSGRPKPQKSENGSSTGQGANLDDLIPYTEEQKEEMKQAEDVVRISKTALDISRAATYAARDQGNKRFTFSLDPEVNETFVKMDNGKTWTGYNMLSLLHTRKENSPDPGFVDTSYHLEDAGGDDARFTAHRGPFLVKSGSAAQLHNGYQINGKGMGKRYL